MVEDRITDGKRIAELLSSELEGLETGPLAAVSVVDADPELTPTPEGAPAYRVSHRDRVVGRVVCYPDRAVFEPTAGDWLGADDERLVVSDGVAVKRAVDAIRNGLAGRSE
ncbi:hypothetical protein BRC62_04335 [Halobacteriales archaeon QH_10_67_13]|nr:MAG: hypothetical protein BRC62_04335 [Halobacteriales archaeon QH_10_67_13]